MIMLKNSQAFKCMYLLGSLHATANKMEVVWLCVQLRFFQLQGESFKKLSLHSTPFTTPIYRGEQCFAFFTFAVCRIGIRLFLILLVPARMPAHRDQLLFGFNSRFPSTLEYSFVQMGYNKHVGGFISPLHFSKHLFRCFTEKHAESWVLLSLATIFHLVYEQT